MSIELRNVTYTYNEGSTFAAKALDDVSVTIGKGEFVGLIGHTGSGKSTLIQQMNGLLKPTSGQVLVNGQDIAVRSSGKKKKEEKAALRKIRQQVGLVFQYPEHQLFEMTIAKDVAFGPERMGLEPDEVKNRVDEALEIVGIEKELREKSPFELSGGQKRRVAIAGVLAMKPEVLVLDEPTAGLDPHGREEILERIRTMHARLGITVILVSHSMEDIARLVSRIIVMDKGKVKFSGTPREIFSQSKELEKIGLAAPQISYLMNGLKEKGFPLPTDVYTVEEACDLLADLLLGTPPEKEGAES